ncbi:MAG: TolC family protein [bacterium]|nr:TolC family protein [bacterium]
MIQRLFLASVLVITISICYSHADAADLKPAKRITLEDALERVLKVNPELKSYMLAVKSKNALILQAGLLPNPELEMEAENLGQDTISLGLNQLIERGNKRSYRIGISEKDRDIAEREYEIKRRDIIAEVNSRFLDALEYQRKLELIDKTIALVESILVSVQVRVKAGASMAVEKTRAQIDLSLSKLEKVRISQSLFAKKSALAAMWGGNGQDFDDIEEELNVNFTIHELSTLLGYLSNNCVMIQCCSAKLAKRKIEVEAAKAERIPDITMGVGYIWDNANNDNIVAIRLSIDLPTSNKNQGNIQEAELNVDIAEEEKKSTQINLQAQLIELYTQLKGFYHEANVLEKEALPYAESAFNEIERLYSMGKISYLDLLDARKTLIEMQASLIESHVSLLKTKTAIERLIGTAFENINPTGGM